MVVVVERDFAKLRDDLRREYQTEIATGRVAGYVLYARKEDGNSYLLLIPPGAVVLFERMPDWKARLQSFSGRPNLKGVEVIPVA